MMQLILSPAHGWEDLLQRARTPEEIRSRGFYPLTAITSLSVIAGKLYGGSMTSWAMVPVEALIEFMTFFVGYFVGVFVMSVVMPSLSTSGKGPGENRIHVFVLYCMGLLELIALIQNLVPMSLAIILFLPLYVAFVIWKGGAFLGLNPQHTGLYMVAGCLGVIAPTYVLNYLFHLIMPSV